MTTPIVKNTGDPCTLKLYELEVSVSFNRQPPARRYWRLRPSGRDKGLVKKALTQHDERGRFHFSHREPTSNAYSGTIMSVRYFNNGWGISEVVLSFDEYKFLGSPKVLSCQPIGIFTPVQVRKGRRR